MDERQRGTGGGHVPPDERLWVAGPKRASGARRRRSRWGLILTATLVIAVGIGGVLGGPQLVAAWRERTGTSQTPSASPSPSPSPSPSTTPSVITGLATTKIGPKVGVHLAWDPVAATGVTYAIARDGAELGRTTDPTYVDEAIAVGSYYYYSITAYVGTERIAATEPLLVAVLSREQIKTSPSPTASAPIIVIIPPPPAPSPTATATRTATAAPPPSPTKTSAPSPTGPSYCEIYPTASLCK